MPDFLPRSDAALLQWSCNFDQKINTDPVYGISPDTAARFHALWQTFADALAVTSTPGTRSAVSVAVKQAAREAMLAYLRPLKAMICSRSAITDSQRILLGCKPMRVGKGRVIPPAKRAPGIAIASREGSVVTVNVYDAETLRRKRPAGALHVLLFTCASEETPTASTHWSLNRSSSKSTVDLTFPPTLSPGARVWIMAQWSSPTGGRGPSTMISTWIAGGAPNIAAA